MKVENKLNEIYLKEFFVDVSVNHLYQLGVIR